MASTESDPSQLPVPVVVPNPATPPIPPNPQLMPSQAARPGPSLFRNIVAGSASSIYAAIIAILMAPVYIHWLGKESYGLIAFATVLQGWLAMLDLGLTQAFTREVARYHGGALPASQLRQLLRVLAVITSATAVLIAVAIAAASPFIANSWLKTESLSPTDAAWCVACMGLAIAARWPLGLMRGILTGSEAFVWLGGANIILASLRAFGVLGAFALVAATPIVFFVWQALVSVLEVIVYTRRARALLPEPEAHIAWSWQPLRHMLRFSLSVAFMAAVWTGITQLDRLILSTLLPLADYAVYALAVLAASGVTFAVAPIAATIQPRLARIAAGGDIQDAAAFYRRSSHVIAIVAAPLAAVMATQAESILWAWTGDAALARTGAPIAALYAIGNGLIAIGAFQYYLQFAYGNVRLNIWFNIVYALTMLPLTVFVVFHWGAYGAAWTWLGVNAALVLFWTPVVHARFAPGIHRRWLIADVGLPVVVAAGVAVACGYLPHFHNRLALLAQLLAMGAVVALATALSSRVVRQYLAAILVRWRQPRASLR